MALLSHAPPTLLPDADQDTRLCARIEAEFREMPGLTLTLRQAARLFNIEVSRCERILCTLVSKGRLITDGQIFASAHGFRRSTQ